MIEFFVENVHVFMELFDFVFEASVFFNEYLFLVCKLLSKFIVFELQANDFVVEFC